MSRFVAQPVCVVGCVFFADDAFSLELPVVGQGLEAFNEPYSLAQREPKIEAMSPSLPISKDDASVKLKVRRFQISGNTLYSDQKLLKLIQFTEGREWTLAELQQAMGIITGFYRRNGYLLARAYLPVQEINDGIVTIAILEGRIGRVSLAFDGDLRFSKSSVRDFMTAMRPGTT